MIGVLFLCYLVISVAFTLPYIVRYLRICRLEEHTAANLDSDLERPVSL